jgi:hypothetical protein
MKSKHLLAAAILLPFMTISSVANAREYSPWQKAAWQAEQRVPNAYAGPLVADQYPTWELRLCTYQGGPKTNSWTCR